MDEKYLYILLDIIDKQGNIHLLRYKGLTFKEIANLTQQAIQDDLVNDNTISLSPKGITKLSELKVLYKNRDYKSWIKPENESKISQLPKDFIFTF